MYTFCSALRSALATSDRALSSTHLSQRSLRPVRARNRIAGCQSNELRQAKIDPDACGLLLVIADCDLNMEDDVPLADLPSENRRGRLVWQSAVPTDTNF